MAMENKGFFYTAFRGKKIWHRNWIYKIECVIKNVIDERRVILEKFKKNNHQIWIKYDGAIPVTEEHIVFVTDMWAITCLKG